MRLLVSEQSEVTRWRMLAQFTATNALAERAIAMKRHVHQFLSGSGFTKIRTVESVFPRPLLLATAPPRIASDEPRFSNIEE